MYLNVLKKKDGNAYLSVRKKYYVPGKGSMEKTVKPSG